jgi:hypothetical protein
VTNQCHELVLEEDLVEGEPVDFSIQHCLCPDCYPEMYRADMADEPFCPGEGTTLFGICGAEFTHEHTGSVPMDENGVPLNPCPECLTLMDSGESKICNH